MSNDTAGRKPKGDDSPIVQLVTNPKFDAFIICVIVFNCILMALTPPEGHPPSYITNANWFFNIVYIIEVALQIQAFGIVKYFADSWHILDATVSGISVIEILMAIVGGIATLLKLSSPTANVKVLSFIRILRVLRILRPLKALTFLPSVLTYIEAVFSSFENIFFNVALLLFTLVSTSMLSFGLVKDKLTYRCVPENFNSTSVINNIYYQHYGEDYFYTSYNTMFCGHKACDPGFSCQHTDLLFDGVLGDYSSPWKSFISNMSFLTLRGWPNIFWAVYDAVGPGVAFTILLTVSCSSYFLVVNLFPAIFIVSLKRGEERQRRIEWLKLYPGDINQVSELELIVWANRHDDDIRLGSFKKHEESIFSILQRTVMDTICCCFQKKKKKKRKAKNVADEGTKPPVEYCKPTCAGCGGLRELFATDGNAFNKFIIVIVLFNIFIMGIDYVDAPRIVHQIIYYSNLVFLGIFAFEILVKVLVLGPYLYFTNGFNLLDVFLVVMAFLSALYPLPKFILNFRIFRLLRLARLYRLVRLIDVRKGRDSRDPSISIGRLVGMLEDLLTPMMNVSILMFLMLYIYSILGVQFFHSASTAVVTAADDYLISPKANETALDLSVLELFWSGEPLGRLNFKSFSNSFVTVFNAMVLNSWYDIMVNVYKSTGHYSTPWFFFVWIVLSNYFLISTLMASITTMMEKHAQSSLSEVAKDNKVLIQNMASLRNRMLKRNYFMLMKQNTIETEEARQQASVLGGDSGSRAKKPIKVAEGQDEVIEEPWLEREMRIRQDYSLYLFSPEGFIRVQVTAFLNTSLFQGVISGAVILAVISIIAENNKLLTEDQWATVNFFVPLIFLLEMVFQWIALGFIEYLKSVMNVIDFAVNLTLLAGFIFNTSSFNQFRIIRLAKLPHLLIFFTKSRSLRLILDAYVSSAKSFFSVTFVVFAIILFFAVVGLQMWMGTFSKCSYDDYPAGKPRYHATSMFPNGCSGYDYLPVDNSTELVHLTWETSTDNFDDIFSACRCVFRVFLMNNWAPILFNSMDVTGSNVQPSMNNQPANFLYFLFLGALSITLGVLYMSVIYYHYVIAAATTGRKKVFGEDDALWILFEEKLVGTKMLTKPTTPHRFKQAKRYQMYNILMNNKVYQAFLIVLVMVPIILIMAYRPITYANPFMIIVDCILSMIYVAEYLLRFLVIGPSILESLLGQQELLIVGYLIAEIIVCVPSYFAGSRNRAFMVISHIAALARLYRIVVIFPIFSVYFRVLHQSSSGFIPTMLNLMFLVLIFGALANITIGYIDVDYGNDFLNSHFNFKSFINSWITLIAMGTGNMWTEVIDALKLNQSTGMKVYIEIFFVTFYVLFFSVMRAFAIMIISRYLDHSGGSIGLPEQQLRDFRKCWKALKNPSAINVTKLMELLKMLKPPLGIKYSNDMTYVNTERFTKRVLACMPSNSKRLDDFDKKATRELFTDADIPKNISLWADDSKKKFTFTQVLLAVFKNAITGKRLSDELDYQEAREFHAERLGKLKLRLGRLVSSKMSLPGENNEFRNILVLQRLDPQLYRKLYIHIMNYIMDAMRKRITSFGFKGFDGFAITAILRATSNELKGAENNLELRKRLNPSGLSNTVAVKAFEDAQVFLTAVRRIHNAAQDIYEKNVDKLWKVETLDTVAAVKEKKNVSAIAMDSKSNIYAGFGNGLFKIWKHSGGYGPLTTESRFKLFQSFDLKNVIRSIVVVGDGQKLFVACENEIVIYVMQNSRRKKPCYAESARLNEHNSTINCMVQHVKYLVTGSSDGYVYLWSLTGNLVLNSYSIGGSVFAMTKMTVTDECTSRDDATLTDVVISGTSTGLICVLPLPLINSQQAANESATWEAVIFRGSNVAVSSVTVAFGFLYTGFVDGVVKVWALQTGNMSLASPIRAINFINVCVEAVHGAPVTGLTYAGGFLFSSSHDYSILPWERPEKLTAKTSTDFTQRYLQGHVAHTAPIIAMSSNSYGLVTGDDKGKILVSAPSVLGELISGQESVSSAKCVFSFLEYDFKMCFLPHNGMTLEEECYLDIINESETPVTIRSLFKRSANFRIDFNKFHNHYLGANIVNITSRSGKTKEALEIGPNHSARFRFVFVPNEEKPFQQIVEFMVNENEIVRVLLKGYGVKPRVSTEDARKFYDFDTVTVGDSLAMSIKLVNHCAKDIIMNLSEEVVVDESSQESMTLTDRNIQIIPRCFSLKAKHTASIMVRFAPEVPMSSFDIPLKFTYAGATYTIANIRARSQLPRSLPNADVGEPAPAESLDQLQSQVLKQLQAQQQQTQITPTIRNFGDYGRETRGMRKLALTESLCPGYITNMLLQDNGWRVQFDQNTACFLHLNTGAFLEIICSKCTLENSKVVDKFTVDFSSTEPVFYEVWHVQRLIAYGYSNTDGSVTSIALGYADLFHGDASNPMEAIGNQTLELMLYSLGKLPRQSAKQSLDKPSAPVFAEEAQFGLLRSITFIHIVKGLRMCQGDDGTFETYPRVDVKGVERIVSYFPKGLGLALEIFGQAVDIEDLSTAGSPHFSTLLVTLHGLDSPTHFTILDSGQAVDPFEKIQKFEITRSEVFKSSTGIEFIDLHRPPVRTSSSLDELSTRTVDIKCSRKDINHESSMEMEIHSTTFQAHSCRDLMSRALASKVSPYALCPHDVRSAGHNVKVSVVCPENESMERVMTTNMFLDVMRNSTERNTALDTLSSLFNGCWYFILDGNKLKLVSADPDLTVYSDLYEVPSVDILFNAQGALLTMENASTLRCEAGRIQRCSPEESLAVVAAAPSSTVIRIINSKGVSHAPLPPPKVLLSIWDVVCREEQVTILKQGMIKSLEKHQQDLRKLGEKKAVEIMKQFEDAEKEKLAKRHDKTPSPEDINERKQLEMQIAQMLDNIPTKKTFKEVYAEIVRQSYEYLDNLEAAKSKQKKGSHDADHGTKKHRRLNVNVLSTFLENVPLAGTDRIYTRSQVEVLLRDLKRDVNSVVSIDNFKTWFQMNQGRQVMDSLTESSVYALFLEEYLLKEEGRLDSEALITELGQLTTTESSEKSKRKGNGLLNKLIPRMSTFRLGALELEKEPDEDRNSKRKTWWPGFQRPTSMKEFRQLFRAQLGLNKPDAPAVNGDNAVEDESPLPPEADEQAHTFQSVPSFFTPPAVQEEKEKDETDTHEVPQPGDQEASPQDDDVVAPSEELKEPSENRTWWTWLKGEHNYAALKPKESKDADFGVDPEQIDLQGQVNADDKNIAEVANHGDNNESKENNHENEDDEEEEEEEEEEDEEDEEENEDDVDEDYADLEDEDEDEELTEDDDGLQDYEDYVDQDEITDDESR